MSKMNRGTSFWIIGVLLAFIVGVLFASNFGFTRPAAARKSVVSTSPETTSPEPTSPKDSQNGRIVAQELSEAFEAAAETVSPAVVPIFAESVVEVQNPFAGQDNQFRQFFGDDFFKRFFGGMPGEQKEVVHSLGSGVIVDKQGHILTNNHVIAGAEKLTVVLGNNQKYSAKVVGADPQSDVAVIEISAKDLPVATLGNSENVKVGQWVIAVGNPFQLMHTVTAGIISAKGRSSVGLADYEDFIQTDASINPGNSGGALADLDGNVIAINTAISTPSGGNVGIGFAIPINMARNVMDQLITKGKVTRGYLGLLPQDITSSLAKALDLKTTEGALVGQVVANGPSDRAGIKRGDIIIAFNGQKVQNSTDLRNMVAQAEPGTEAKVTLIRDGKTMDVTVKLVERPTPKSQTPQQQPQQQESTNEQLGINVQNLTPDIARQLGYQNDHGVVITDVAQGSPAADAGLQRGDLIEEVDRSAVTSVRDFDSIMSRLKSGSSVAFLVRRGNDTFYVALQVP